MNKKIRLTLIIILSILLIGAVVLLYFATKEKLGPYNFEELKVMEQDIGEYKKIEVPEIGLRMDIPINYLFEKESDGLYAFLNYREMNEGNSVEILSDERFSFRVSVGYFPSGNNELWNYDILVSEIEHAIEDNVVYGLNNEEYDNEFLVKIDEIDSIGSFNKISLPAPNNDLYLIWSEIKTPFNNRIYTFETEYSSGTENAEQIMNQILESIKINQ